jgi:long-chain fatty acid transport protein
MTYRGLGRRAAGALGLVVIATGVAHAGAFGIREQSAYGLGSAYAGIAAGGSLSSMFWNPATMTQFGGMQSETVLTGILPYAKNNVGPGTTLSAFGLGGTDNIGIDALVPSGYTSYQLNSNLWIGLATNSPFGLAEHFPNTSFGGRTYAGDASVKTYNASPSIAYKVNDWLSIAAGAQIQYMSVDLLKGIGPLPPAGLPSTSVNLDGAGWGYGYTLGATLKPTATTTIGVGYRSGINQKINGTLALYTPLPGSTPGSVNTSLALPGTLSVGVRQQVGPQWTLLGTFEWTNWSRIGTADISQPSGAPAVVLGTAARIPFEYRDGWFASVGAEYKWSETLTLRGGVGFERSPITDDVRIPLLPDNDRTWAAIGATWNVTPQIALDFGYSHIFVKDTSMTVGPGNPSFTAPFVYNGTVDSHVDIISLGFKYRWDAPAAARPPLVTKG